MTRRLLPVLVAALAASQSAPLGQTEPARLPEPAHGTSAQRRDLADETAAWVGM